MATAPQGSPALLWQTGIDKVHVLYDLPLGGYAPTTRVISDPQKTKDVQKKTVKHVQPLGNQPLISMVEH